MRHLRTSVSILMRWIAELREASAEFMQRFWTYLRNSFSSGSFIMALGKGEVLVDLVPLYFMFLLIEESVQELIDVFEVKARIDFHNPLSAPHDQYLR